MMQLIAIVNGYKTYIIAVVAIAYLWTSVWTGAIDAQAAIEGTFAALGGITLRHAQAKTQRAAESAITQVANI